MPSSLARPTIASWEPPRNGYTAPAPSATAWLYASVAPATSLKSPVGMYVAVNESSTACSPASKARNASRLEVEVAAAEERRRRRVGVLEQQPGGVAGRVADLRRVVARLGDARRSSASPAPQLQYQKMSGNSSVSAGSGSDSSPAPTAMTSTFWRARLRSSVSAWAGSMLSTMIGSSKPFSSESWVMPSTMRLVVAAVVARARAWQRRMTTTPSPLVSRSTGSAAAAGRRGRRRSPPCRLGGSVVRGRRRPCRPRDECRRRAIRPRSRCACRPHQGCRSIVTLFPPQRCLD